jgi:hypothetical protein
MDSDMKDISCRVEAQLAEFETNTSAAMARIKKIERALNARIVYVKKLLRVMRSTNNPMVLSQIIDILGEIERVSDKLTSVDATPSGYYETSLESMTDQEYDEMEALLI